MRRFATAAAVAASVALPLAGCGSGEDPTVEMPAGGTSTMPTSTVDGSTTTPAGGSSTTIDRTPDDAADVDAFEASAVEVPSTGYGHLVAIRHAPHDDYYRVVFEFRSATPGLKVEFVERPVAEDGSGKEIDVAGNRVLSFRFEPASGFDLETSKETYTGPRRLEVEQEPVVELVRTGDFEAVLNWVAGVDDGTRFRVTRLDDPPRLVIDLK